MLDLGVRRAPGSTPSSRASGCGFVRRNSSAGNTRRDREHPRTGDWSRASAARSRAAHGGTSPRPPRVPVPSAGAGNGRRLRGGRRRSVRTAGRPRLPSSSRNGAKTENVRCGCPEARGRRPCRVDRVRAGRPRSGRRRDRDRRGDLGGCRRGAVAAVQLAKLAGSCRFFTVFGDDELGRRALAEIEARGVTVEAEFVPRPTRRGFTYVDEGERTITVIGEKLHPLETHGLPWMELARHDGVYFTAGDPGALRAARRAKVLVATARGSRRCGAGESSSMRSSAAATTSPNSTPPATSNRRRSSSCPRPAASAAGRNLGARSAPAPLPGVVDDAYGAGDSFAAGLTFGLGLGSPARRRSSLPSRGGRRHDRSRAVREAARALVARRQPNFMAGRIGGDEPQQPASLGRDRGLRPLRETNDVCDDQRGPS